MTTRERGEVFGEVADEYEGVRPGYPDALAASVLRYAGTPRRTLEVGAGTGKATCAFVRRTMPIHCLEPDPRMAAVLRARMADHPAVTVEEDRFEDWQPPTGGVDLLYSAQAWHWLDPEKRWRQAHTALAPGGTVAIFAHSYKVVDPAVESAIWELHHRLRPGSSTLSPPGELEPDRVWFTVQLAESGHFTEPRSEVFHQVVAYPTGHYLDLIRTFSSYRTLHPAKRLAMREALTQILGKHGGVIEIDLATVLALGRRQDRPSLP